eukprot:TRINITY_DN2209_c0_g1_i1.p1 TRINITY_DN2209_c0_g1~~TRINITY_DN2209_c0_g1_i1.p1  ORF type:complete len:167 (-),score=41.43 TRINITY_DN2209_c0_g1_i1:19-519(-)
MSCSKYDLYEKEMDPTKKEKMREKIEKTKKFCEDNNYSFEMETSAKTGFNVNFLFEKIMTKILNKRGIFAITKKWEANEEMDSLWEKEFRKIVITLLLVRKEKYKTFPKAIFYQILTDLSGLLICEGNFPDFNKEPEFSLIIDKGCYVTDFQKYFDENPLPPIKAG